MHAQIINYTLKSEVAIMLHLQPCSTRYTVFQVNTMNLGCFGKYKRRRQSQWGAILCYHKLTSCVFSEKNWRTREGKGTVNP